MNRIYKRKLGNNAFRIRHVCEKAVKGHEANIRKRGGKIMDVRIVKGKYQLDYKFPANAKPKKRKKRRK